MLSPYIPKIPNLDLGFLYYFGNHVSTGRFTADYVLPFRLNCDSVLFGEAHAEGWDFWKKSHESVAAAPGFTVTSSPTSNRVDLSFGGGYRTMLGPNTVVGVNGFYDTSHLFNRWYSSGGVGLEMAANVAGDDAIDLNFNWYGNLFNKNVLINAFRNKGNSYDVEAGYSHPLFNRSLDLRLKAVGYQFGIGTGVYGWRTGADLTTRNGVFTLRYEHGRDRLNGDYNTVGGFVTVGFQLENLLSGESPFTMPEPAFRSPRDLRRLLGLKVKRNWHQPAAVVLTRTFVNAASTPCDLPGYPIMGPTIYGGTLYDLASTSQPLSTPPEVDI
jgi:Inverse autotransporter, beta-domain